MQANEKLYKLMESVSSQLECMTCSLATHIENAGIELEEYKYKVFNDFYLEVRELEIDAVREIRELFQEPKDDINRILERVNADESSKRQMEQKLSEIENMLNALVIHTSNMREINAVDESVIIPEPQDKLYEAFSGFGKILDKYKDLHWESENAFESIIFSFFNNAISIFERLCIEYDKLLHQIALELKDKQEWLKTNSAKEMSKKYGIPIKKNTGQAVADIALAAGSVAVGVAGMLSGKKNIVDVGVAGLGLLAKISEAIGDPSPGNKSSARKILNKAQKKIEAYNDAVELAGVFVDGKLPDTVSSTAKLMLGAALVKNNGAFKEGQADRIINVAGLAGGVIGIATIVSSPLKTPKEALNLLKNGLYSMNCGLNIIKDIAEKSSENPKSWDYAAMKKVNTYFKEYENNIKVAQLHRKKYGFAKKVIPPPGIKAVNCISLICDIMDVFQ